MTRRGAGLAAVAFAALLAGALHAQPAEFEAASVKPNASGERRSGTSTSRGKTRMRNETLRVLIRTAFDVRDYSLIGPSLLDSERFDVVGKFPAGVSQTQIPAMLQALLKRRLGLAFHWELREFSGFALVTAAKGAKIKLVEPTGKSSSVIGDRMIHVRQQTMEQFARLLEIMLDLPVQDLTGMPGLFDFTLLWTPGDALADPSGDVPPLSLLTALQDELGLQLRAQKVTVRTLVVEHVERVPSAN
jgi:uncharacterized protein (TIGR03435 family)